MPTRDALNERGILSDIRGDDRPRAWFHHSSRRWRIGDECITDEEEEDWPQAADLYLPARPHLSFAHTSVVTDGQKTEISELGWDESKLKARPTHTHMGFFLFPMCKKKREREGNVLCFVPRPAVVAASFTPRYLLAAASNAYY